MKGFIVWNLSLYENCNAVEKIVDLIISLDFRTFHYIWNRIFDESVDFR